MDDNNQMFYKAFIITCFFLLSLNFYSCQNNSEELNSPPEIKPLSLDMLGMPREKIVNEDHMIWIFNGRGKIHPPSLLTNRI